MTLFNYDRRIVAMEHPSDDARKKYLEEHPQADPKNHTVKDEEKDESDIENTETFKTKRAVNIAMRAEKAFVLLHKMGVGKKDARAVIKGWFQDKKPSNPKHEKAWDYLNGPGKAHMGKIVNRVHQELKKDLGKAVKPKDIAKFVDAWLATNAHDKAASYNYARS